VGSPYPLIMSSPRRGRVRLVGEDSSDEDDVVAAGKVTLRATAAVVEAVTALSFALLILLYRSAAAAARSSGNLVNTSRQLRGSEDAIITVDLELGVVQVEDCSEPRPGDQVVQLEMGASGLFPQVRYLTVPQVEEPENRIVEVEESAEMCSALDAPVDGCVSEQTIAAALQVAAALVSGSSPSSNSQLFAANYTEVGQYAFSSGSAFSSGLQFLDANAEFTEAALISAAATDDSEPLEANRPSVAARALMSASDSQPSEAHDAESLHESSIPLVEAPPATAAVDVAEHGKEAALAVRSDSVGAQAVQFVETPVLKETTSRDAACVNLWPPSIQVDATHADGQEKHHGHVEASTADGHDANTVDVSSSYSVSTLESSGKQMLKVPAFNPPQRKSRLSFSAANLAEVAALLEPQFADIGSGSESAEPSPAQTQEAQVVPPTQLSEDAIRRRADSGECVDVLSQSASVTSFTLSNVDDLTQHITPREETDMQPSQSTQNFNFPRSRRVTVDLTDASPSWFSVPGQESKENVAATEDAVAVDASCLKAMRNAGQNSTQTFRPASALTSVENTGLPLGKANAKKMTPTKSADVAAPLRRQSTGPVEFYIGDSEKMSRAEVALARYVERSVDRRSSTGGAMPYVERSVDRRSSTGGIGKENGSLQQNQKHESFDASASLSKSRQPPVSRPSLASTVVSHYDGRQPLTARQPAASDRHSNMQYPAKLVRSVGSSVSSTSTGSRSSQVQSKPRQPRWR